MKISPTWIRNFIDPPVDDRKMAEDLTDTGTAIEGFSGQGKDLVYEAEVTTNRVDAMNHYGIAREVSAIYDLDLKPVAPKLNGPQPASDFKIEIEDAKGCARYTARIVRNVKVGPSPEHIVHRLELIDQRSISNVADATNYVLNELGQPTHAFDLDKLQGGKIVVRRAREGEVLKTLDGVERKLSKEDLVIADAFRAVALAGIMGGYDTMITEQTRNVLIESAWFDPGTIRRTSRRLGMHTDASHRFERGADFGNTPLACARVAELAQQTASVQSGNGSPSAQPVVEAEIDALARRIERPQIHLRQREVQRILGVDVPGNEIARILSRLGFKVTPGRFSDSATTAVSGSSATKGSGGVVAAVTESVADFVVGVPTWRLDVDREIDLIEEVGRIYGYLKLPNTLPAFAGAVIPLPNAEKQATLRQRLLALGYNESISSTFISAEEVRAYSTAQPVRLENPLSEEAACMRSSLVPGMVNQIAYNLNRGNTDVRLFESGDIFEMAGERVDEKRSMAFVATGSVGGSLHGKPEAYTFYDMKGDLEALLSQFEHATLYFDQHTPAYFHPGRSARAVMDGTMVARFGQLHPELASARKLRQPVYVAEILVERLFQRELRQPNYRPVPRFPAADRDFSFLFDAGVLFERIQQAVETVGIAELQEFRPVEILRGEQGGTALPPNKYAILLRARFRSAERTLRDDEVAGWAQQIVRSLEALGGKLRG
ncbi:MAG: phenylalanine--tRNA ligase subunit beta [Candidatus Korobacteraceae bacterium]|jgi:phenylalanyl-tRNA synthetase beta chain